MRYSSVKATLQFVAALALLSASFTEAAALKLNAYFNDDMVLQHGKPVQVRGLATPGAEVTVSFADQSRSTSVDKAGKWTLALDALPPSAQGRALKIATAGEEVVFDNVVVGDVWLFARQSQTDISLGRNREGQAAARAFSKNANLRAVSIRTEPAKVPQDDLSPDAVSDWQVIDRVSAAKMSGAAFYLGARLAENTDMPVGIIDLNMGPWFALGWMSKEAIADAVALYPDDGEHIDGNEIAWLPELMIQKADEWDSGKAQKDLDDYYQERVLKRAKDKPSSQKPSLGLHPLHQPTYPSAGYNAVIHPLRNVGLKGVLLQLGNDYPFLPYTKLAEKGLSQSWPELNEAWAQSYKVMKHGYRVTPATLPMVPGDWRQAFGDKELPIAMVMPPGSDLYAYAAHNREIREMQRRLTSTVPGLGLIMPGTDNIPLSGQPEDDEHLAERCHQWIAGHSGPVLDRVEITRAEATILFKEGTAEDLQASQEALAYFEAAGPDRVFYPADARVEGSTIKLKSERVEQVAFVRYNWQERPSEGLVNGAGLPAVPFSTDPHWKFAWLIEQSETDLPEEYHLTANEWAKQDVAIVNAAIQNLQSGGEEPIPRRPGPIGIYSSPFGPNIYVISVEEGSPAAGKLQPRDLIYGVNGKVFGEDPYRDFSEGITFSESEEGKGAFVLGVRRGRKNIDVELTLDVLGTYSSTTPYFCPKTERLIENAENWITGQFRPTSGIGKNRGGFLGTDMLFLIASGNPEQQGLVRRYLYEQMEKRGLPEVDPHKGGVNIWGLGYASMLAGEYYHATGDKKILPYLKNLHDWMVMTQIKPPTNPKSPWEYAPTEEQSGGWRQRYHSVHSGSTYGLMPHAGMACVMGFIYAKEAGLDIDQAAYDRGLMHYHKGRAEHAYVQYTYANARREAPDLIDPEAEAKGLLWTQNGKLGAAAALYGLVDDHGTVAINSRFCVYTYNNTRHGHGGMYFNNFWTPIGAHLAGEKGFKHFMKGQTWWRELYRRHDGAYRQLGARNGDPGVSFALHYVAPRKGLRMLGGPRTAFGPASPAYLKPALSAHAEKNYAECEALILKEQGARVIPAEEKPMVEHLLASVRRLQASMEHDLGYTEAMLQEGRIAQALFELPQLKGVVSAKNPRLQAIISQLENPEVLAAAKDRMRKAHDEERARQRKLKEEQQAAAEGDIPWTPLLTVDEALQDNPAATRWKMHVVESPRQAPEGWSSIGFDASDWEETTLPVSWRMYHTGLFRTTFDLEDPKQIQELQIRGLFFRQANVLVYINGKLMAKVDNIGRGIAPTIAPLTDSARKSLRKGRNTIAISTLHTRRWGVMRGTYTTVVNNGFDFTLDAKLRPGD